MNYGVFHRRCWKDVAYEAIPITHVFTRTVWHSHRLQHEALKVGVALDWNDAHKQAHMLVLEEDRLGRRLDFSGAC